MFVGDLCQDDGIFTLAQTAIFRLLCLPYSCYTLYGYYNTLITIKLLRLEFSKVLTSKAYVDLTLLSLKSMGDLLTTSVEAEVH